LVDLASVILLAGIFNWKIAIAYVIVGLILAVIGMAGSSLMRFIQRRAVFWEGARDDLPSGEV